MFMMVRSQLELRGYGLRQEKNDWAVLTCDGLDTAFGFDPGDCDGMVRVCGGDLQAASLIAAGLVDAFLSSIVRAQVWS